MAETSKIAYLLERLAQGVAAHDRENPGHHTWGIGMSGFDIERLGLEEGEEILPGIVLQNDGGVTGRSGCCATASTTPGSRRQEEEIVDAVASEEVLQPVSAPGSDGPERAPQIKPPF